MWRGSAIVAVAVGLLLTGMTVPLAPSAQASEAWLDDNFNPGANSTINSIVVYPESHLAEADRGKILIGGNFTEVDGQSRHRVARLNPDGTLDTGFIPPSFSEAAQSVQNLALQPDGGIVIVGNFTSVGGSTRNRIARLNSSGSLDSSFNPNADGKVWAVHVLPSGKLLIGGEFLRIGGVYTTHFARLNSDGTLDTSLVTPNIQSAVYAIAVQSDNKILIGGSFVRIDSTNRNRIARLNTDGSLDDGFMVGTVEKPGTNSTIVSITVYPQSHPVAENRDRILIGGYFETVGDDTRQRIALLNSDGTLASGFDQAVNNRIRSVSLQADGRVLIGGDFTEVGGSPHNRFARLNADGMLDTQFNPSINNSVTSFATQADGRIIVVGGFSTVDGIARGRIARLEATNGLSALTPTFDDPVRTANGYSVNVTNYDANFTWTQSVSAGSVAAGAPSGTTLPLIVTGLTSGASSTLTATTTRTGYITGSATAMGQAKNTQIVSWAPVTAITTVQSPLTPSTVATALDGASISYSVVAGFTTSACMVNASTGQLTYAGTGSCTIRARSEPTSTYVEGSTELTFTVSKSAQTVTWAPLTSLKLPAATVLPTAATAWDDALVTYSKVSNTTSSCSVVTDSGAITYAGIGNCVVRATAASTDDYEIGFTDVTFTVTKETPSILWNPSLFVAVPEGSTMFEPASSSGAGSITYAVTNAGSTGCSLPNSTSRVLSFTAEGSCEVTATVSATSDYDQVSSVKTFAVLKAAQTLSWSPATFLTLSTLSAPLAAATSSGDGAITYTITSTGGSGCAIADGAIPVLTYNSTGSCTVTATAASTSDYAQATQSAIIAIELAVPSMSWAPNPTLMMPATTLALAAATTTSLGFVTYAVTSDSGANCSVDASSAVLTYTATGQCRITATSAATSRYAAGSSAVTFTVSLVAQSITASASSTSLQPGQTATVIASGESGTGAITWVRASGVGVCSLAGTTVTAVSSGNCVITVSISPDTTFAAASSAVSITVTAPWAGPGGASEGGGEAGASAPASSLVLSNMNQEEPSIELTSSQDRVQVPGTGAPTRGRALPPAPADVEVVPSVGKSRSTVLIKQPVGAAGSQVLATVVVVRDAKGKVVSRLNVALKGGQGEVQVTVPFIAEGYSVNVYNVNEVGVSVGALTASPLVRATTITRRGDERRPTLFGAMLGSPIIFTGASSALSSRAKMQLNAVARSANASNERIFITGFARKGGGTANELGSLSTQRARSAAKYLATRGVRVWIRYWGAGSLNGTGKSVDRRVEVRTSALPIPRSLVP